MFKLGSNKMPKNQDNFEQGQFYHIYNRAVGSEKLFLSDGNRLYFLQKLSQHLLPVLELHAYCLLDNHFHLLVRTRTGVQSAQVSNAFRSYFIGYTKALNKQLNRNGGLFTRPFKRKQIDSEAYYSQLIRYIHHNPIKHQVWPNYKTYKWSSYPSLVSDKPTSLSRDYILEWFGGLDEFKRFHDLDNWELPNSVALE